MKKLRSKVFLTIFLLLTSFLITILIIFNYLDYNREKENIQNNLTRLNNRINNPKPPEEKEDNPKEPNDFSNRIFMDLVVYTIILDNNNNIIEIFNHNEDNNNTSNIEKQAQAIIKQNPKDKLYIGNLYLNKYSYSYIQNKSLTIIDNTLINERLLSNLRKTLIIIIIFEIIIIIATKKITNWLIKPAIDSFNKQKEFIADASHELKTPLAVIMASSDALEDNPKETKWLDNIKNETIRMSNLITDLLNLATLDSTQDKNNYPNINLSKAIEKQVLIFESIAFEQKITIDYNIEKDIKFNCNSNQMKQLISILLDNAIKHSYKNECITVNLSKLKNEIILQVTNKGDPIPKEAYDKIFERFYRLDKSRNRKENRYGLGLAIAKSIVINHKGKISVESLNNYTTFTVTFR